VARRRHTEMVETAAAPAATLPTGHHFRNARTEPWHVGHEYDAIGTPGRQPLGATSTSPSTKVDGVLIRGLHGLASRAGLDQWLV